VQWWSVWYPGAEPGGGSYIAQRVLASKSERDALAGTLFFNFAHYVLRPWPWILVALCSLVIYPELSSIQQTFPRLDPALLGHDIAYPAMMKFLPAGWLGLMIAGLLAAYVSTMITHLNWGTSYLVHDFYQRFLVPGASERHYVAVGRVTTVLLMVVASALTWFIESSKEGFGLLLQVGAGTGLIYLLRWFWWRINAWTEIAAMIGSFVVSAGLFVLKKNGYGLAEPWPLVVTVGLTTVIWLVAAYTTQPTDRATLVRFVKLVRPPIAGWKRYHQEAGVTESADSIPRAMLGWVVGCVAVWSGLFCVGSFLFGRTGQGFVLLLVFGGCAAVLVRLVGRLWAGAR
jgi:Na+/proline symporter